MRDAPPGSRQEVPISATPSIRLSHAGFHVFDLDRMVDFFTTVYGLEVTDRGTLEGRGEIAFLGADPRDHHQLVLYQGRTARDGVHHNHVSFEIGDLDRLREIHRALKDWPGVANVLTVNHGVAWRATAPRSSSTPHGMSTSPIIPTTSTSR